MTRAFTDVDGIAQDVGADLDAIRASLPPELMPAINAVETFAAVALRVMAKTNPSKIRDAARTVEIKARMDGVPVEPR
jgi:hypothetical protein